MYIKKLKLQNFKRFTSLTIDLCPSGEEVPKLVLLIGQNGCGKSSVFDALSWGNNPLRVKNEFTDNYYLKNEGAQFSLNLNGNGFVAESGRIGLNINGKGKFKFYGRTAFRYIPVIDHWSIGGSKVELSKLMFEEEKDVFAGNVDMLFGQFLESLKNQNLDVIKNYKDKINSGFANIFGTESISLKYKSEYSPISNISPVRFTFSKGECEEMDYSLLSAGEKMVFLILFDLYNNVWQKLEDTVIYYDELDLHLNTSIQKNLLKEITENWIPDSCQFWTASHSLGFIDYAREYEKGAIIDFDSLDCDEEQTLKPKLAHEFDVYDVVFGTNSDILLEAYKNSKLKTFVCEGSNQKNYAQLNLQDIYFTDKYGSNKTNKKAVIGICQNEGIFGLIDRDYLTDSEVAKLKFENERLYVTDYYTFENYLYHPKNLAELGISEQDYIADLTKEKNKIVDELVTKISLDRNSYKELNSQEVEIKKALESDSFEVFYKYLNINKINKSALIQKYKLANEEKLSRTKWFREQIQNILNNN